MKMRSGREVIKTSRFMVVMKVSGENWKDKTCDVAIRAELHQLFEELILNPRQE